jgi:hypothetical protein
MVQEDWGVWAAAIARRRPLPWWKLVGAGRSRPSGPHFGRGLAREVKHNTANTSRRSRKLIRARAGAPHGGGGTGSWQRGGRARTEGERKGKRVRRVPYHPWKLRRRLAVEDRFERRHGSARLGEGWGCGGGLGGSARDGCG